MYRNKILPPRERTPYEYGPYQIAVFSVVEEGIFGAFPIWLAPTVGLGPLLALWISRIAWAILHLGNEQVQRYWKYRKRDFFGNMFVLGLKVPVYVYLWYWNLWPLALAIHAGWNFLVIKSIQKRLKKEGFRDFWVLLEREKNTK